MVWKYNMNCKILWSFYAFINFTGGLVVQAVRRSPSTTGVWSLGLCYSMWVSWWMNWGLGRFSSGLLPFSPYHKFHSTISPHSSHPYRFISSALVMVRQAWSASTLATHWLIIWGFIASHPSARPCVGHELRIFILFFIIISRHSLRAPMTWDVDAP